MCKKWLVLLVICCLFLVGCNYSVLDLPSEFKEPYIVAATEYMESKYPDIPVRDAAVGVYDAYNAVNERIVCVTFKLEGYSTTFDIWNALTYPLDNVSEVLFRDEAKDVVWQKANDVFGYDIIVKPLSGDIIGSRDTEVYEDVNAFLSQRGTFPFILGFIGSEAGKRDLIDQFIEALVEDNIAQNFVCCLYPDLATMRLDLKDRKGTTFVTGDYTNWISVVDDVASDWLKED